MHKMTTKLSQMNNYAVFSTTVVPPAVAETTVRIAVYTAVSVAVYTAVRIAETASVAVQTAETASVAVQRAETGYFTGYFTEPFRLVIVYINAQTEYLIRYILPWLESISARTAASKANLSTK